MYMRLLNENNHWMVREYSIGNGNDSFLFQFSLTKNWKSDHGYCKFDCDRRTIVKYFFLPIFYRIEYFIKTKELSNLDFKSEKDQAVEIGIRDSF